MDQQRAPQDRPAFPEEAVAWLAGATPRSVVVLDGHVGTGEVVAAFEAAGHDVTTTERDRPLPRPDRSVDVVVAAQGLPDDLAEVARVLRPGGQLALVWNDRDQRIPWTRKLDRLLGTATAGEDPEQPIVTSALFGFVEERGFRYWQTVTGDSLAELVRAELAGSPEEERERKVAAARELYDDYGRGADGMQMPWVSRCFRASVVESPWSSPRGLDDPAGTGPVGGGPDGRQVDRGATAPVEPPVDQEDPHLLLIDFR